MPRQTRSLAAIASLALCLASPTPAQGPAGADSEDLEGLVLEGLAGAWYDPSRDGEGFNLVESEFGLTTTFYGYTAAGGALWLLGDTITTPIIAGQAVTMTAYAGEGGSFEAPTPGDLLEPWGTITVVFDDCHRASFELDGADGRKTSQAVKLLGVDGNRCRTYLAPGDYRFSLQHDGEQRAYLLHVPPDYAGSAAALFVDFHGLGVGNDAQSQFSGFRQKSDEAGFLVAWPQGLGLIPSWNAGACCGFASANSVDDVGFARALVADIATRTAIDARRVYATGQSNGGALSQRLACEAADLFAGVAPVAYPLPDDIATDCAPARPVPVLHFHGLSDAIVPYAGNLLVPGAMESFETWAEIHACLGPPIPTLSEGASFCDRYESCADGVINELCSVDAGHGTYPNPDIDIPDRTWELLSPYVLPD